MNVRLPEQDCVYFYFITSSYWLYTGNYNSVYLTQSTGDEIPGIDATLYLLSLYSLLRSRGGPLMKKRTQHTLGQRVQNASLCGTIAPIGWAGGATTLSERVDSSPLRGYWSNPMYYWVMRAAMLSGVPLQCAQGCLSAAPGSAAVELKLCQESQTPSSVQHPLFSRM